MRATMLLLIGVILVVNASFLQAQGQDHLNYIDRYKDIAIREMERAGIPASIKLAQALLESGAGNSDLARRANNHFGIKCNAEWDGKKFYRKDDDYDDRGKLIESCFRVYKNPEASFIAHSDFLRDPVKHERYGFLFDLDITDYKRWARGLRSAGYATAATYDNRLIDLIERYELYRYDKIALDRNEPALTVNEEGFPGTINGYLLKNDVKYVLAMENEPLEALAKRTYTSVNSILDYNEELRSGEQLLPKDQKVYIQPKRNSYRGKQEWHFVKPGETMTSISNEYAIKLAKLYDRNKMQLGTQPAVNERIKLRGGKVSDSPKLLSEVSQIEPLLPDFIFDGFEEEPTKPSEEPITNTQTSQKETELEMENAELDPIVPTIPTPIPTPDVVVNENQTTPAKPQPSKPTPSTKPGGAVSDEKTEDINFQEDIFTPEKPSAKEEITPAPVISVYHTVVKGDTLWNISQRYDLTVETLKKINNLNSNNIGLGMKLKVK